MQELVQREKAKWRMQERARRAMAGGDDGDDDEGGRHAIEAKM